MMQPYWATSERPKPSKQLVKASGQAAGASGGGRKAAGAGAGVSAGLSQGQPRRFTQEGDYMTMTGGRPPAKASSRSSSDTSRGHLPPSPNYDVPRASRPALPKDPLWFILLEDKEVKWRQSETILTRRQVPDTKKALRGSLLRGVGPPAASRAATIKVATLADDVEFECRGQEVAQLTEREKDLLLALTTDAMCFGIYQEGRLLAYAAGLRLGDAVRVRHRNLPKTALEDAAATVRYVGPLTGTIRGTRFGLELMEEKHRGHGTSDGEFRKTRYFFTEPDCAIFVAIDKLVPPEPGTAAAAPAAPTAAAVDAFFTCPEPRRLSAEYPGSPKSLAHYGEIHVGAEAYFSVGNIWHLGKVVFIAQLPGQSECHVAIEMPKSVANYHQPWDGKLDRKHLFTPREDMHTYFIPANFVIPEHLMPTCSDKQPSSASAEWVVSAPAAKAKTNVRRTAEPFYEAIGKPQKSTGRAGSESSWRGATLARNNISDSVYPGPSLVNKVKGRLRKLNNGSSDEDPAKAMWYAESASEGHTIAKLDFLEEDVVAEIAKEIQRNWRTVAYALQLRREEVDMVARGAPTEREQAVAMLHLWQEKGEAPDMFSLLTEACRSCSFDRLADSLEQGLDDETLTAVARGVSKEKVRPLGTFLNISETELDRLEAGSENPTTLVRRLLAKWRMKQSHGSDKILLLSQALEVCGLKQLALEVARGLDDDLMLSFAVQIGHDWKILAMTLGLSTEEVLRLQDFAEDKQPYQMLMQWRQRLPRQMDLLGKLSRGLLKAGRPKLAKELVQGVDNELIHHVAALTKGGAWERLVLQLGLSEATLTALKVGATSEVDTAVRALCKWRERHDYYAQPRLDCLLAALRAVGLGHVAGTLEEELRTVAEEEERRRRPAMAAAARAQHAGMETKYITRELLVRVAAQLDFKLLCAAIAFPTEVYVEIENLCLRPEQRSFAVLDRWNRRGEQEQRSFGELLQVIAAAEGKATLLDEVMRVQAGDKKEGEFFAAGSAAAAAAAAEEVVCGSPLLGRERRGEALAEVSPDLEVDSMVEFSLRQGKAKYYGVIRWIGVPQGNTNKNLVAGIELESPLSNGATDGIFNKKRYFQCEPNKAMFVYLYKCRPDSRFPSQSQTFRVSRRQTSQDFGGFPSPLISEFVDPPESLQPGFVGMRKGIQGDQNSCYLDATLYSMFAFCSVFDPLLHRVQGEDDLQLYEEVQRILREGIVNPLRKNGFVRADRILQLREHLDNLGTTKGLMSEEKDPEEFLHTLLNEVFKSQPLLRIRHGDSQEVDLSNIHQILLDKNESCALPTVEQLLLQSFQEHNLKLVDAPTCLTVQMPRFGKDYKMYNRIVPSLQIDITNIIENYPRQCVVCGNLADKECPMCMKEQILYDTTHSYCNECFHRMHIQEKRAHHKLVDLYVPDAFLKEFASKCVADGLTPEEIDSHRQALLAPRLMDLFAVICIRTSHYVAFVKAGRTDESEWVFFDSMADRQGDQQGYNIPQVTHLKDFKSWVTQEHIEKRVESKQLTDLMERLLGDAYICMYADMDKQHATYL